MRRAALIGMGIMFVFNLSAEYTFSDAVMFSANFRQACVFFLQYSNAAAVMTSVLNPDFAASILGRADFITSLAM